MTSELTEEAKGATGMPPKTTEQANGETNKPSKLTKLANSNALAVVVLLLSLALVVFTAQMTKPNIQETSTAITEIFGVKIHRNPPQATLTDLGVTSWKKWEGGPSKFPWTFEAKETMYILEGKVKVYCDGHDGFFEIGAGDLVEFPKGMKVTWDVIEAVSKHYSLEK